jgi:pimeloyl-ACP methyl ester carboxylesterase
VAEAQYAESRDGTRIAYRASGVGPAVVFVHGAGTSGADWTFAVPFLRERCTVVAMDRRGRGASEDGPAYAMEREAEDVLVVLDAVGSSLLVAHSYGALCSMVAASQTDRLERLVLYEPPIAVRGERVAGIDEIVGRGEHEVALESFLRGAGVRDDQLELIRASPAWPVLLDAVPALPRELHACTTWRPPSEPINVPTLFLLGGDTRNSVYLEGHDELRALFPGSRCEKIAGQLHIAHVLAAEEFAARVAGFLFDDG